MIIKGRVLNADGTLQPPTRTEIEQLQAQLNKALADRAEQERVRAEAQRGWDTGQACSKVTGSCNRWLDKRNAAQAQINSLTVLINDLQNVKIPAAETRYKQLMDEYNRALKAQTDATVATNPALAGIKAQADAKTQELMLQAKALANKNTLIWGAVIMAAILGIVLTIHFIKKRKG